MYPQVDETLENALKKSDDSLLKKFKITLLTRKWETEPHCIMISHFSDDSNESEDTYDSESRNLKYLIFIKTSKIDDLAYLESMKKLGKVVYRIKKVLRNTKDMIYINEENMRVDLREGLKIGQIVPEIDNYVIKSSQMEINIPVDEEDLEILDGDFDKITTKDSIKWGD